MADRAALLAELTGPNASRYAAALTGGSNSELVALLSAPSISGQTGRRRLSFAEAVDAAGAEITPELLDLLKAGDGVTLTPGTEAAIGVIAPKAVPGLVAASEYVLSVSEAAGIGVVELPDLWAVLPQVAGSMHKVQLDAAAADAKYATQRAIANRVAWHAVQQHEAEAAGQGAIAAAYAAEKVKLQQALDAEIARVGLPPAKGA